MCCVQQWLLTDDKEVRGFCKGVDVKNGDEHSHTVSPYILLHTHSFTHTQAKQTNKQKNWGGGVNV